jgi:Tol biopolymer transport system component
MTASGADKSLIRQLDCCVGSWYMPVWSPDGQEIAFAADSQGQVSGT